MDRDRLREQSEPVFVAVEEWERGSVYEPNLVYADGMWKMWYVAGSNQDDYLVQGFAESGDGRGSRMQRGTTTDHGATVGGGVDSVSCCWEWYAR